ncbi:hypothetical protein [Crenobacter luteus]|uniref:hypothetical protein n=1 Tax=Crenobacter luteus TaxID=1452487 RepID=UPI0012E8FB8A|nr:hypothetical protein [Crenobacter luteus]
MSSPLDPVPLPPPEPEARLAGLALPLGETVVAVQGHGDPAYGTLKKSRANTAQSDYFRVVFQGFARVAAGQWQRFEGEDAASPNNLNSAWARVDHPSRSVAFGPKSGVALSAAFAGGPLDAYLFAQVIAWAKTVYPDYRVAPGVLSTLSLPDEDKLRVNAFFASQGFDFEWGDGQKSAHYGKDRAGRLLGVWDAERVNEVPGAALLDSLAQHDAYQHELEHKLAEADASQSALRRQIARERHTNQIMTGVTAFVLLVGLLVALDLF